VSLFKSASVVSLLTLLSRICGMLRELLVASIFGASALTDAFNVAFRIPNLFRRLFAEGAFSQAFVPVLSATLASEGEQKTQQLIAQVATLMAWILVLVSAMGVLAAPVLVWLMASGLEQHPQGMQAAVVMTRWMFPYIGLMSMVALAAGILNTWKRFAVPAATPVLLNLCMIASAWFLTPWFESKGYPGIYALAVGVMVGGVMQLWVQIVALKKLSLWPSIGLGWSSFLNSLNAPGPQKILHLMMPSLLGVSVAQLSLLINTQIASHMITGSVSWLNYADRLMEFPTAMLGVALGVVLTPQLSKAKSSNDVAAYSSLLDWGLRWVFVLSFPCALALLFFSTPMVCVLYNYGHFSVVDVEQTQMALMGYGVGLMGLVAIKVLAPGFYAQQDTKTPVKIAIVILALTQLMNLLWVPLFAHAGLALSIGLGAMLNALGLWIFLKKSGSYRPQPGWSKLCLQVAGAGLVMGLFLFWANANWNWVLMRAVPLTRILMVTALMGLSVVIYLVTLWCMGFRYKLLIHPHTS
jgi:putative peptidoglycan lipid II flippase